MDYTGRRIWDSVRLCAVQALFLLYNIEERVYKNVREEKYSYVCGTEKIRG